MSTRRWPSGWGKQIWRSYRKRRSLWFRWPTCGYSSMVVVELQYPFEMQRIIVKPQDILVKLNAEIGLSVCDYPFPIIAEIALGETWTRDPFDRIIVAHAKANDRAPLLTKDEVIRAHYPNARW